jgi:nucleoside-diphosphate-sugar epimerase
MPIQGCSCMVAGGCGFLGTNLCRRHAAAGNRVHAFDRRCMCPPSALIGRKGFHRRRVASHARGRGAASCDGSGVTAPRGPVRDVLGSPAPENF